MSEKIMTYESGSRVISENEVSRKMFIIKSGKARVFKTYMGKRITLAVLGAGEVFGELSFFDAEPRSASIEALTPLQVIQIEGDRASQHIEGLPNWVVPIFRTVFHRFREADQKMTVLQNISEFQKKSFKNDKVAQTIYIELLRFLKALRIIYERSKIKGAVQSDGMYQELDEILGEKSIGLRVFWKTLKEHHVIDHYLDQDKNTVDIDFLHFDPLVKYLSAELESERYLLLSHTAVALLGRIVGFTHATEKADAEPVSVTFNEVKLNDLAMYKEAVEELKKHKLVTTTDDTFAIRKDIIANAFIYQTILKAFDHTIVNTD